MVYPQPVRLPSKTDRKKASRDTHPRPSFPPCAHPSPIAHRPQTYLRELRALRALAPHPNVVTLVGAVLTPLALVLERTDRGNLAECLDQEQWQANAGYAPILILCRFVCRRIRPSLWPLCTSCLSAYGETPSYNPPVPVCVCVCVCVYVCVCVCVYVCMLL